MITNRREVLRSSWAQEHYNSLKCSPEYLTNRLMLEIGDQIYARIEDLGITQQELAKRIRRSPSFVSRHLNYGNNMTLATLVVMADALDLVVNIRLIPKQEEQK